MKTVLLLASFLARVSRAMGESLVAFFRFTEEDALVLLSAYGFHAAEIERLQKSGSEENGKSRIPLSVKRYPLPAPSYGPIPLGLHFEFVVIIFGTASKRHLHRFNN
jgi:hypothetical protein